MIRLVSVNASGPKSIQNGKKSGLTGIFKLPLAGKVQVHKLGLEQDTQVDKRHHGGPDQAVYVYSADDYAWWSEQLGMVLEPGTFGENLTFSSFGTAELYIGDRYRLGSVLLEVTAPRIPCSTLAARMNDTAFVKRFQRAARPGFYARVVQEGLLEAGDTVVYARAKSELKLLDFFALYYQKQLNAAELKQLLAAPIASRSRNHYEEQLEALGSGLTVHDEVE
jgi:MOSC domain-containing protein YiiM